MSAARIFNRRPRDARIGADTFDGRAKIDDRAEVGDFGRVPSARAAYNSPAPA
jgi:hypothetical protein